MRRTQASLPIGLRAELLYLIMGFVETFWITPFVMVFLPGALGIPGYQLVLLVLLNLIGALLIIRLMNNQDKMDTLVRLGAMFGLGLIIFFSTRVFLPGEALEFQALPNAAGRFGIPPVLITLVVVAMLWFRGSRLATITVTPLRASFGLRLGIIMLMFAALIPEPRIQRGVLLILPLFFFFGLIIVALARSASLRLNREVYQSTFGVSWVALTFSIGGMLSIFGFVAALVLSGFRFDTILNSISEVLVAVIAAAATIISPLIQLIIKLIEAFRPNQSGNPAENADLEAIARKASEGASVTTLAEQIAGALPMICLSAVLILIFALILMRLRVRRPVNLRDGEIRDSVEAENLLKGLQNAINNSLQTLGQRLAELNPLLGRDALTALTIRRLYARMVALAGRAGQPRLPYQTPLEYQAAIIGIYPGFEREIGELTRAYVDVHYGELPDDPGILQRARAMLDGMEQQQQRLQKQHTT